MEKIGKLAQTESLKKATSLSLPSVDLCHPSIEQSWHAAACWRSSIPESRFAPLFLASATMSNAGLCRIRVLRVLSLLRSASFCSA
jgi:hypothetical protein